MTKEEIYAAARKMYRPHGPVVHFKHCKGAVLLKRGEIPNPLQEK